MHKSLKGTLTLIVVLVLVILAAGCGKKDIVATVNGEDISKQQLGEMVDDMKKYYKSQGLDLDQSQEAGIMDTINSMTLDQLITQTLLLQEAKVMGIGTTKDDVDKEIARYKESMTEEKFSKFLKDNDLSESRLRGMLEKDLIISNLQDKILEDVKPVTEDQVREYYEKNKTEFISQPVYEVRHILAATAGKEGDSAKIDLEARTKIQAILEQLKQGKDFSAMAKEKSEDPGTAAQGGTFTFSSGEAVMEFEVAAKALKPGEMTLEPVKTTYGYHLIKMDKITPEKQKTFDEVKEQLVSSLTDEAKQDKVNKFIEDVRKKAEIVNKLEKPEDKNTEKKE